MGRGSLYPPRSLFLSLFLPTHMPPHSNPALFFEHANAKTPWQKLEKLRLEADRALGAHQSAMAQVKDLEGQLVAKERELAALKAALSQTSSKEDKKRADNVGVPVWLLPPHAAARCMSAAAGSPDQLPPHPPPRSSSFLCKSASHEPPEHA